MRTPAPPVPGCWHVSRRLLECGVFMHNFFALACWEGRSNVLLRRPWVCSTRHCTYAHLQPHIPPSASQREKLLGSRAPTVPVTPQPHLPMPPPLPDPLPPHQPCAMRQGRTKPLGHVALFSVAPAHLWALRRLGFSRDPEGEKSGVLPEGRADSHH